MSCLSDFAEIYKRAHTEVESEGSSKDEIEKKYIRETVECFVKKLSELSRECMS